MPMKDPRQFGSRGMFRGFRVLLIVCGILLVVMVTLFYMSRQSHAKPTDQEPVAATPGQPEVPAGFVQEAPQEVQLASAETETQVVSNPVVVTNNTFKVELEFEFQKGQRVPKQQ